MAENENEKYLIEGHYYQYDLKWLIDKLLSFEDSIKQIIDLQTIHYADPIQWDITTQYSPNTVVVDPKTGTAYMSKVAVPVGIQLDNDNYWVVIFNYQKIYEDIMTGVAYYNGAKGYAEKDLQVNDLLWEGTTLYRATRAIPAGSKVIEGTNVVKTSIESLLATYYGKDRTAQVTNDTLNVSGDYTLNAGDIATTSDNRTIKVTHDNEVDVDGNDSLHVDGVTTINRGGAVTEANGASVDRTTVGTTTEVFQGAVNRTYNGKVTETAKDYTATVDNIAITADSFKIQFPDKLVDLANLDTRGFKTVFDFGAKGDGVTDDSDAFQSAIDWCIDNGYTLVIPRCSVSLDSDGYYLTKTLNIDFPMTILADPLAVLNWRDAHLHTDTTTTTGRNGATRRTSGVGINIDYGSYGGHKGYYRFGIIQGDKSFIKDGAVLPTGHYWSGVLITQADLVDFWADYISFWNVGLQTDAGSLGGLENGRFAFGVCDDCNTGISVNARDTNFGVYTCEYRFNTIGQGRYGISFSPIGDIKNNVVQGAQVLVECPDGCNVGVWSATESWRFKNNTIRIQSCFNGVTPNTKNRHGSSAQFHGVIVTGDKDSSAYGTGNTYALGFWDNDVPNGNEVKVTGEGNTITNLSWHSIENPYTPVLADAPITRDKFNSGSVVQADSFKLEYTTQNEISADTVTSLWFFAGCLCINQRNMITVTCYGSSYPIAVEDWSYTTPYLARIIFKPLATIPAETKLEFLVKIG